MVGEAFRISTAKSRVPGTSGARPGVGDQEDRGGTRWHLIISDSGACKCWEYAFIGAKRGIFGGFCIMYQSMESGPK